MPDRYLRELRSRLLNTYRYQSDSRKSIESINVLLRNYYQQLLGAKYYNYDFKQLIADAAECKQYHAYCLQNNNKIETSVHILPKGMVIPNCDNNNHGYFCLTIVEYGTLRKTYKSTDNSAFMNHIKLLSKGDTCVELPGSVKNHDLKAMSDVVVFIRIRVRYDKSKKLGFISRLFTNRFVAPVLCMVIPFMTGNPSAQAADMVGRYGSAVDSNVSFKKIITKRMASLYRQSKDYANQVGAAEWYQESARSGDAESQYWLGVMYLDGSGITEDDDEALYWIGKAADQGYLPAEKLLDHLLATNFDMDC